MLSKHKLLFAYLLTLCVLSLGMFNFANNAYAQSALKAQALSGIKAHASSGITINQPGSPAVLIDGNKIIEAKPDITTKPRRAAAPAPADSYTSRGGVPQSSTEETHLSNGLVCKTEKGQRTCR
jgi:hypothetical protein